MADSKSDPPPPNRVTLAHINREAYIYFGAGATVVWQMAMPGVGRGVANHSTTLERPLERLRATMAYVYAVSLGSDAQRAAIARHVNRGKRSDQHAGSGLHGVVHGQIECGEAAQRTGTAVYAVVTASHFTSRPGAGPHAGLSTPLKMEAAVTPPHPQSAHTPSPTPPDEIPGQIPNPGRDPTPDQPIDPVPDQPADPTIPPIKDPVPGEEPPPVRDPDPHPDDPPRH